MDRDCVTTTVGGRLAGPDHAEGSCDDAFGWARFGSEYQVLAMADGAGSFTGTSACGSWTACAYLTSPYVSRALVGRLLAATSQQEVETVLRSAFGDTYRKVVEAAQLLDVSPELLSTTLQIAVITPRRTFLAAVGDGIFGVDDPEGVRTVLIEEKGDGPANGTTFLAKGVEQPEYVRVGILGPVDAIALLTDGLRYELTHVQQNYLAHIPSFQALWRNVRRGWTNQNVTQFLAGVHEGKDQARDDKSLVLATRCPPTSEPRPLFDIPEGDAEYFMSDKPTHLKSSEKRKGGHSDRNETNGQVGASLAAGGEKKKEPGEISAPDLIGEARLDYNDRPREDTLDADAQESPTLETRGPGESDPSSQPRVSPGGTSGPE